MLVTYVDRCPSCACSSLRDEQGRRPVPGLTLCEDGCRCHAPSTGARSARASLAATAADAARLRFWRRSRSVARVTFRPAAR